MISRKRTVRGSLFFFFVEFFLFRPCCILLIRAANLSLSQDDGPGKEKNFDVEKSRPGAQKTQRNNSETTQDPGCRFQRSFYHVRNAVCTQERDSTSLLSRTGDIPLLTIKDLVCSSNAIQQVRECQTEEPFQYVATEIMAARRRQAGA